MGSDRWKGRGEKTRGEYSIRKVRRRGVRDGRSRKWQLGWPLRINKEPVPGKEDPEEATFQNLLRQGFEHDIVDVSESWTRLDQRLKPAYCEALREYTLAKEAQSKEGKDVSPAEEGLKRVLGEIDKLEHPTLDRFWMKLWLVAIAVTEFPVNYAVFQILGAGPLETVLVGLGLALVIPLFADRFAEHLKQKVKTPIDRVLTVVLPIAVLGILLAISIFRGRFFQVSAEMFRDTLGISIGPVEGSVLFVLINIGFFVVAFLVSYAGSYAEASRYRNLKRQLDLAEVRLEKETDEAEEAGTRFASAVRAVEIAKATRQRQFDEHRERARELAESCDWFIAEYRTANLRTRNDRVMPKVFTTTPASPGVPSALTDDLNWECFSESGPPTRTAEGLPAADVPTSQENAGS